MGRRNHNWEMGPWASLWCIFLTDDQCRRYLHGGVDAFRNLFGNPISYVRYGRQNYMDRATNLPDNFTTDVQAEVLIKDRIPKNCIIGVAFPDDTYQVEKQRLSFCLGNGNLGINIERLEDE